MTAYNIIISGDFYVAAYFLVDSSPSFHRDDTSPDSRTYARNPPGGWMLYTIFDEMIRAVVEQVLAPTLTSGGGMAVPVNKLSILAPYLASVGLVGGVTAAFTVKRRRKA